MSFSEKNAVPELGQKSRVVLVEDEDVLRDELAFQLQQHGLEVVALPSAEALYRFLSVSLCGVVLLDIGLPGESGLEVCQYLRENDAGIGIVFLTAHNLRDDRLSGLAAGADAYLVKPVDIDELILTVSRLLDRVHLQLKSPSAPAMPVVTEREWQLKKGAGFLCDNNGVQIRLSMNESLLLQFFFSRPDQVCSHADLATALGMLPDEFDKHRVEVLISRLRTKVLRLSGKELSLESLRGRGYSLKL